MSRSFPLPLCFYLSGLGVGQGIAAAATAPAPAFNRQTRSVQTSTLSHRVQEQKKSLKDPAVPYEDCAPRRQLLERCSHAAIGLLLDVALMPPPARAAEPSPWPEADGE